MSRSHTVFQRKREETPPRIGIGSTNPVKVTAAQEAIQSVSEFLKKAEFRAFSVESGVSAQPFSDEETVQGARNRAQAVLDTDRAIEIAIGIEGGVFEENEQIWSTVWICVRDRSGLERVVNGLRFLLPKEVSEGLRSGKELGQVMDEITGRQNMKHQEGMIGVLTGGAMTRGEGYHHLIRLAFALYWQERQQSSSV